MIGDGERLEVETAFGTLVATRVGDPGVYDEIEIGLVSGDGAHYRQLAIVGATEPSDVEEAGIHVYAWNSPLSEDPDDVSEVIIGNPSHHGNGCWYDIDGGDADA